MMAMMINKPSLNHANPITHPISHTNVSNHGKVHRGKFERSLVYGGVGYLWASYAAHH